MDPVSLPLKSREAVGRKDSGDLGTNSVGGMKVWDQMAGLCGTSPVRQSHSQTSLSIRSVCTKVILRSIVLLSSVTTGYVYRE